MIYNLIKTALVKYITFKSIQSKLVVGFGFIALFISFTDTITKYQLFLIFFGYLSLAKNIDCLIYGNCIMGSWLAFFIALFGIIITILYRISYFNKYKHKIDYVTNKINRINDTRIINTSILKN